MVEDKKGAKISTKTATHYAALTASAQIENLG